MSWQWTFAGAPPVEDRYASVTLVEGSSFCIGAANGDLLASSMHGLFFRDTRILSRWEMRVDGHGLQPLVVQHQDPFSATFVSRTAPRPGKADSTVLVQRHRSIGDGMREDLVLENLAAEAVGCEVSILVDADFADVFEVKENRVANQAERINVRVSDGYHAEYRWMGQARGVLVTATPAPQYVGSVLSFQVVIPARGQWSARLKVQASVGGAIVPSRHLSNDSIGQGVRDVQLEQWRAGGLVLSGGRPGLLATLRQSQEDLGVLRIFDEEHPEWAAVAAGAPWYMSLFGRDSLLSAWMALPLDPGLAIGTLQTLARYQGESVNPITEEQPGRIMHERRSGLQTSEAPGGAGLYYGSADATALFVMLLAEVRRWGALPDEVDDLLAHADRALQWILGDGDPDRDGFVEYRRATDRGLINQGWKDSWDGVNFASGRLAEAPIALCEVQGYTYAAFQARAALATAAGDLDLAAEWLQRAETLKSAFNAAFWLPDRGYYAIALDSAKRPVDALASNMAHCLWTGIVDEDKAPSVVAHLMSAQMYSGWGIRTLATSMGAYNAMSYHNGSVWPHDNAIAAAGLVRYGFIEQAQRVALGILDAAEAFGGRLPELFCGFDRGRFTAPVAYPASCSPQAWAAAAPVHLLRTLLRLEPHLPEGSLKVSPVLPAELLPLCIDSLPIGDGTLSVSVDAAGAVVCRAPDGLIVDLGEPDGRRSWDGTNPGDPDLLVDLSVQRVGS